VCLEAIYCACDFTSAVSVAKQQRICDSSQKPEFFSRVLFVNIIIKSLRKYENQLKLRLISLPKPFPLHHRRVARWVSPELIFHRDVSVLFSVFDILSPTKKHSLIFPSWIIDYDVQRLKLKLIINSWCVIFFSARFHTHLNIFTFYILDVSIRLHVPSIYISVWRSSCHQVLNFSFVHVHEMINKVWSINDIR
jgi:hypothetical protein